MKIIMFIFAVLSINMIIIIKTSFASLNSLNFTSIGKITASDGNEDDKFGNKVDISENGNYAIVGERQSAATTSIANHSVYFYKYDSINNVWNEESIITYECDWFGRSVAITDDIDDSDNGNINGYAIIGCASYSNSHTYTSTGTGTYQGAAFIYERDDSSSSSNKWQLVATLTHPNPSTFDYFGDSVSISGNFAIVGVSSDDDKGSSSIGSAFIYTRDSSTGIWSQVGDILLADDGAQYDEFGTSVSITASGNNDQVYAIIGAPFDNDKGSNSGSAYIFERDGNTGTFIQTKKLMADDGSSFDLFGWSVSISLDDRTGDVNAIIGAYRDDNSRGAAYIFSKSVNNESGWYQVNKLVSYDAAEGDVCGDSVSIDSINNIALVGCHGDDDKGIISGSVYVYTQDSITDNNNNNNWSFWNKIVPYDGTDRDNFGCQVSLSNRVAIVGAYGDDDDNGSDSGSVYLYSIESVNIKDFDVCPRITSDDDEYYFSLQGPITPVTNTIYDTITLGDSLFISLDIVVDSYTSGDLLQILQIGSKPRGSCLKYPQMGLLPSSATLHTSFSLSSDNRDYDVPFEFELNRTYNVIFKLFNGTVSQYIDGILTNKESNVSFIVPSDDQDIYISKWNNNNVAQVTLSNIIIKSCVTSTNDNNIGIDSDHARHSDEYSKSNSSHAYDDHDRFISGAISGALIGIGVTYCVMRKLNKNDYSSYSPLLDSNNNDNNDNSCYDSIA